MIIKIRRLRNKSMETKSYNEGITINLSVVKVRLCLKRTCLEGQFYRNSGFVKFF
jgi:hypothetical protein